MELTDFLLVYLWIIVEAQNPLTFHNVAYTVKINKADRLLFPIMQMYESVTLLYDGEEIRIVEITYTDLFKK